MDDRTGNFAGNDPFEMTRRWLAEAEKTELNDPNAIALATVGSDGMPNVRIVLLKSIEDNGFVFYTNYESAKGAEISASGKAAFTMHWKSMRRQIRVRGTVEREDGAIADAYYLSRSVESRLGAWASLQSQPLDSRQTLMNAVENARETHGESPSRPPYWGGFRIIPKEIEFWADGTSRLHDRFLWRRSGLKAPWEISRLYP